MNTVFIGIQTNDGSFKVFEAHDYQCDAYQTFMKNIETGNSNEISFNDANNQYFFKIVKFDNKYLTGNYSSFCTLVNERGEMHILSNNEQLLRGFIGWRNRLTM